MQFLPLLDLFFLAAGNECRQTQNEQDKKSCNVFHDKLEFHKYWLENFSKRAGLSLAQGLPGLSNAHYERNHKLFDGIKHEIRCLSIEYELVFSGRLGELDIATAENDIVQLAAERICPVSIETDLDLVILFHFKCI